MTAVLDAIFNSIKKPDYELDMVIQAYISGPYYFGEPDCPHDEMTVARWRLTHYGTLRRMAYPDRGEKDDAEVKLSSEDPGVQAEGEAQLRQYRADCLAVKARFPKQGRGGGQKGTPGVYQAPGAEHGAFDEEASPMKANVRVTD